MQEHNGDAFTGVDKADPGVENGNPTSRMIVFGTNRHGRIFEPRGVGSECPDRQFQSAQRRSSAGCAPRIVFSR